MAVQSKRRSGESENAAHDRARRLIPGGAHTYSKDDEHFPPNAPPFIEWGSGAYVHGSDNRDYLDWGMGLRSVILGHGYREVVEQVKSTLTLGANHIRPTYLEGELAERLVDLIPCGEMVKFGKNGSDATTAAVRVARAYTGRRRILACDGSFHASDDWWLSTQPLSAGTIEQGTQIFPFNDIQVLIQGLATGEIAAVIMEPMAFEWPGIGYLKAVRAACTLYGALLIFDEVISGFRFGLGGAQKYFGITPDLATFGKGIANGFSVSALVGSRELMTIKGMHLLSSTHGGETHGLAAALATIRIMERDNVSAHLTTIGERLSNGLTALGFDVRGHPASPNVTWPSDKRWPIRDYSRGPSPGFSPDQPKRDGSDRMRFIEGMCRQGILAPYWAPSFSHTEADVDLTLEAAARCA